MEINDDLIPDSQPVRIGSLVRINFNDFGGLGVCLRLPGGPNRFYVIHFLKCDILDDPTEGMENSSFFLKRHEFTLI